MDEQNKNIFFDFVSAVNQKNFERLGELMTSDHKFVDPHGHEVNGKEVMLAGWKGYFQWFPDYKIEIEEIIRSGETIFATGFAGGTFRGMQNEENSNYWRIPASWKVIIKENKVLLWQVYADTKIPFEIMSRNN
jgi:ketosteroid isomerase-like protein